MAKLTLPNVTITAVQTVEAGQLQPPGASMGPRQVEWNTNPAFCRVFATARPSSDSDIRMEVWLPLSGWNGKFMGAANAGWAGSVMYNEIFPALKSGYAVASSDAGHVASKEVPNGSFIIGHPEKFLDYGHRAMHEMTITGKAVTTAFYGQAPKYSLLLGCSLGGMLSLQVAYRYPEDYNGIVVGAPANPMTLFNAQQIWPAWLIYKDPSRATPPEKFKMIHEAALKACAGSIGLKQGFIEEPDKCKFDPMTLLCKGADGPDCLTAGQVDLMRKIYEGPVNPRTHEQIFPGMARGAELQLPQYTGAAPLNNAVALYKYAVYKDANWDWRTMDYDKSIELAHKNVDPYMKAADDLTPFFDHGGKLMIYIGWTDYHNPLELVGYYNRVLANDGEGNAANAMRLFLIPGMDHCFGGFGCDTFDKLGTIDKWVETGKAPEQVLASKLADGKVVRTSQLCAYPKVAQYKGAGDTEDAASFVCADSK
jgi:feruloyl esterase